MLQIYPSNDLSPRPAGMNIGPSVARARQACGVYSTHATCCTSVQGIIVDEPFRAETTDDGVTRGIRSPDRLWSMKPSHKRDVRIRLLTYQRGAESATGCCLHVPWRRAQACCSCTLTLILRLTVRPAPPRPTAPSVTGDAA